MTAVDMEAAVMAALAGADAQHPLTLDQIHASLGISDATTDQIIATLADLVERRAIGTARIGTDPESLNPIWWTTGIPPMAHSMASHIRRDWQRKHRDQIAATQAAHHAHQPDHGAPMPRITAPAAPRHQADDETHQPIDGLDHDDSSTATATHATAPTQRKGDAAYAHLVANGPTLSSDLRRAIGLRSDLNKYLSAHILAGRVTCRPCPQPGPGGYLIQAWMTSEQAMDWDATHPDTPPHQAHQAAEITEPRNQADPTPRVGIALWDDGELSLDLGDEIVRLDRDVVRRLIRLLRIADAALEAA